MDSMPGQSERHPSEPLPEEGKSQGVKCWKCGAWIHCGKCLTHHFYWCTSHQQYVAPKARRNLRNQLSFEIVRLNLTLLRQVDFHKFSTRINSEQLSRKEASTNA